ncbi:MAG TPA: lipid-binding SYLF domain-containing protein [Candidatus Acidoferrales bacterium]|jgi:SH3 domain-containing YSC84-like protein 1|nr:lipid-binding SYLF domain-containing protein [Candidatus Acidoferrales bacterium]
MKSKALSALLIAALIGLPTLFIPAPTRADDTTTDQDRIKTAGTVLKEIMDIPDNIPQSLIDKADCVIVYPTVLKAAFIVGASFGRGVMTCRSGPHFRGPWSAPSMMALEGASFGFQAGGQATDFVILVMNDAGANAILASKVKLGGDASVAAGPVGRNAAADTDVTLRAEMLTYSRARGLFAGISLAGSTVRPDNDGNERIYGKKISAREIVLHGAVRPTPDAALLLETLRAHSPKNLSK